MFEVCAFRKRGSIQLGALFVFLYYFLQAELHINRHEICVMFKSFPNTSVRLERMCVFKRRVKAATVLA